MAVFKASLNEVFQNKEVFYLKLWQINFNKKINNKKVVAYSIYAYTGKSKKNNSLTKSSRTLINPLNYKSLASGGYYGLDTNKSSKEVHLSELYKIDDLKISKNCSKSSSMKFLFDSLGRIHINNKGKMAEGICEVSLIKDKREVKICIDSKSSFVYSC